MTESGTGGGEVGDWICPRYLIEGDVIGAVAPSESVSAWWAERGINFVKRWNLEVTLGEHVFDNDLNIAAGSAEDRMADLSGMLTNKTVKAIWAVYGGYVASQLWSYIDNRFEKQIRQHPKWLVGFSDIGILHSVWFVNKVMSIYGPNISGIDVWDERSHAWLRDLLFDGVKEGVVVEGTWRTLSCGAGEGRLLANNLDTLISTFGTRFDPLENGYEDLVVAVEELKVPKSDIQRQMDILVNHRKAYRIKGLILGRFSDLKTEKEYELWERKYSVSRIVLACLERAGMNIPVVSTSAFGHPGERIKKREKFLGLPNGAWVYLRARKKATLEIITTK